MRVTERGVSGELFPPLTYSALEYPSKLPKAWFGAVGKVFCHTTFITFRIINFGLDDSWHDFLSVLLSSRPWSWSRVVSRPNLPVLVLNCQVLILVLTLTVLVLTTCLGLAFKQDQDLINFYCVISATKLWLLYITETHCPRFDMMHASLDFMQSWKCICL